MYRNVIHGMAVATVLALSPSTSFAQHHKDITLHVNPRWSECAFQLDAALTQGAWRQFTREAGLVAYFRPLTDARPMGRGHVELSLLQWQTGIDDATSAWNDTFVHPYATHWLYEGNSGLGFPGLMLRAGVTSKIDAGVYYTRNVNSNYGFYAGQVQYNVLNDAKRNWAASVRLNAASLFGPDDLNLAVYGLDALASRTYAVASWASLSPYAGVSTYLSRSHEKSAVVNLADESVAGAQAMLGVVARISKARIAMEYNTARVNSRSFKLGVSF